MTLEGRKKLVMLSIYKTFERPKIHKRTLAALATGAQLIAQALQFTANKFVKLVIKEANFKKFYARYSSKQCSTDIRNVSRIKKKDSFQKNTKISCEMRL